MSCQRSASELHKSAAAACLHLNVPDPTTKSNLVTFCRTDYEDTFWQIFEYIKEIRHDDHALAAVAVLLSRLCVELHCRLIVGHKCLNSHVRLLTTFIDWRRCSCTIVAWLQLIRTILSDQFSELFLLFLETVLPILLDTLAHARTEGLVLDLGLQIVQLVARHVFSSEAEPAVRKFASDLVQWAASSRHPLVLKHVMRNVQLVMSALDREGRCEHDHVVVCFYVGLFRAGYPRARRLALRSLSKVAWNGASGTHWHPMPFLQSAQEVARSQMVKDHTHGREACDSVRLSRCLAAFYDAFRVFTVARDVRALGLRLYALISEDPDCICFAEPFDRRTGIGNRSPRYYSVDCDKWHDILSVCAAAVRGIKKSELLAVVPEQLLGASTAEDVADVLLIHHTLFTEDVLLRRRLCGSVQERNPRERYIYYVLTIYRAPSLELTATSFQHIRQLCAPTTFIFQRGLACFIQHLYKTSVVGGTSVHGDEDDWQWVSQCARKMSDLCDEYLDVAPPDARDRLVVLDIAIVTHLFIYGPKEPRTLDNLKNKISDWRASLGFTNTIWRGAHRDTTAGLTELVLEHHSAAARQWDESMRRMVAPDGAGDDFDDDFEPSLERTFSARDLLRWQQRVFAPFPDDPKFDVSEVPRKVFEVFVHPVLRPHNVHHCAACGIRTVMLRRCSQCYTVRYCGPDWRHWREHKLTCTPGAAA